VWALFFGFLEGVRDCCCVLDLARGSWQRLGTCGAVRDSGSELRSLRAAAMMARLRASMLLAWAGDRCLLALIMVRVR